MLSRLTTPRPPMSTSERLLKTLGEKLHAVAGPDICNKLKSGEIARVDGRFTGECLQVKRPSRR